MLDFKTHDTPIMVFKNYFGDNFFSNHERALILVPIDFSRRDESIDIIFDEIGSKHILVSYSYIFNGLAF